MPRLSNPPAVNGLDGARRSRIVPKSPPQLAERLRERVVRCHDIATDGRIRLFLRHQRGGTPGQVARQSSGLGAIPPGGHHAMGVRTRIQPVGRKLDCHADEGGDLFWKNFRLPSGLPQWTRS